MIINGEEVSMQDLVSEARKFFEFVDCDLTGLHDLQILEAFNVSSEDERRISQLERFKKCDGKFMDLKIIVPHKSQINLDPFVEMAKSGIVGKYADMKLTNYSVNEDKQKKVYDWVFQNKDRWMFFSGSAGTGKTHLAVAVLRDKIFEGKTGQYITAFDMLKNCLMDYSNEGGYLGHYEVCDCLVIDECEKFWATKNQNDRNIFFDIIDKRYKMRRQTIMITNAPYSQMLDMMGESHVNPLISRFKEMGEVLKCEWTDFRTIINLENKLK